MLWWLVGILVLVVLAYVIGGRKWLKTKPWAQNFFTKIEPVEIVLWKKSETILWARMQQSVGVLTYMLHLVGVIDLNPFVAFVPPKYQPWVVAAPAMAVSLNGLIAEIQRRDTTKPLALVALPDNNVPLQVKEAVAVAEITKQEAVALAVAVENKPATNS